MDYSDATKYIRLIYTLKKDIEEWAEINLNDLWPGKFYLSSMQVMIYIDENGTTNKTLAKKARISKQAMSRIISNMQDAKVIVVKDMPSDKRYAQILLTPLGKSIVEESQKRFSLFMEEKIKIANIKSFDKCISLLSQLQNFD